MPFADYVHKRCDHCGADMLPLAQSLFCPNDCDRAPETELEREPTHPLARPTLLCPKCQSPDLVKQWAWGWTGHKCVDCKHVF